jgi:hypothetical protein
VAVPAQSAGEAVMPARPAVAAPPEAREDQLKRRTAVGLIDDCFGS